MTKAASMLYIMHSRVLDGDSTTRLIQALKCCVIFLGGLGGRHDLIRGSGFYMILLSEIR